MASLTADTPSTNNNGRTLDAHDIGETPGIVDMTADSKK